MDHDHAYKRLFAGPEPQGLELSEDEAMLAERVKEWTPLTRPEAFEPIAEWVIDARDAEDFLSRLRTPAP
jgi:hypothetical protein